MNYSVTENKEIYLDRMGDWAAANAMQTNPGKSKAVSFTRAQ